VSRLNRIVILLPLGIALALPAFAQGDESVDVETRDDETADDETADVESADSEAEAGEAGEAPGEPETAPEDDTEPVGTSPDESDALAVGGPAGEHPEEAAQFQAALGRFSERMQELQADASDFVALREAEERQQINESYNAILANLGDRDVALRATAMKRFESFLAKYPENPQSAHVKFRLAELYFEQAEEDFLLADLEFSEMVDSLSDEEFDNLPEEPRKDYRKSIALYEDIVTNHLDYRYVDGAYYMLGYCLTEPAAEQWDEVVGLERYGELVALYPDSGFAADAHLAIGEYHFDYNQLDEAISNYQRVVDLEGPDGKWYDEGLYKLAWSYYKRSDFDMALDLLNKLLDWSEGTHIERHGVESPMAPEAVEYTAISLADVADTNEDTPVQAARAFYTRVGERAFEDRVYKRLADVLTQQARYEEAIGTLEYYQQRWPLDPENPTLQWNVATLYQSITPCDPAVNVDCKGEEALTDGTLETLGTGRLEELTAGTLAKLTERSLETLNEKYNDTSEWYTANRDNPDALTTARGYIERTLAQVAFSKHAVASGTNLPEDYLAAAELYAQYLTKFPFAEDYYAMEWWLADTLFRGGEYDQAEREYQQLLKGKGHYYHQASSFQLFSLRRQRLVDSYGDLDEERGFAAVVPPDAAVKEQVELINGSMRDVYALSEDHAALIESCDRLVGTDTGEVRGIIDGLKAELDKAEDLEKTRVEEQIAVIEPYADAIEDNRHRFAYLAAQILFFHGDYAEARPRLEAVIDGWPRKDEAAYSASLMVDSYTVEEDYENVLAFTRLYQSMVLGEGGVAIVPDGTLEGAAFKIAERYVANEQRLEAAQAFEQYLVDYPNAKLEYTQAALYNAANNYQLAGRLDESNRLFEDYINRYPDDERSKPLYFRIANNYASALELESAIRYYETLYDKTTGRGAEYSDAPAALYNAGFLRIGMGDFEGAALTFERYANDNPSLPDAEAVFFKAGEHWERVGDKEALRFYNSYVKKFGVQNPDHLMESHYRIAKLTEKDGRKKDIDRAWDALANAYAQLEGSGKVGSAGRHYAAHAEYRKLQARLDEFVDVKFTKNEAKNAEVLLSRGELLAQLDIDANAAIARYADFEYASSFLYIAGVAYLSYADLLYRAPPPRDFANDDELLDSYYEQIDEARIPVEDKGKTRLVRNVEQAQELKLWSEWQSKSLDYLNQIFPNEFAPEKQEFRADGRSDPAAYGGALPVRGVDVDAETGSEETDTPETDTPETGAEGAGSDGSGTEASPWDGVEEPSEPTPDETTPDDGSESPWGPTEPTDGGEAP